MNDANNFLNTLKKEEYTVNVSIDDGKINARAEFNKELIFEPVLEKLEYPLTFKKKSVQGFGMFKWDASITSLCRIVYYKDDDNFIFTLKPKGNKDELIFIKGLQTEKATTFDAILKIYKDRANAGSIDVAKNSRNYQLEDGEIFAIPELKFNLEKDYSSLTGKTLLNKGVPYIITKAWQRNAMVLNNKGAKIESQTEMEVAVAEAEAPIDGQTIVIQHLLLNNTFS